MAFDQQMLLLGFAAGALSGCIAFLHVLFRGFAEIPEKLPSDSRSHRNYHLAFLTSRVVFGAVVGCMVTFWFLDDARTGKLSVGKLIFIQFAAGGCASFLQLTSKLLGRMFG